MEDNKKAGFWIRLGARVLDSIIVSSVYAIIYGLIMGEIPIDLTNGWTWQIIIVVYVTILPVLWNGYVIGKKICHINIRDVTQMMGRLLFSICFYEKWLGINCLYSLR